MARTHRKHDPKLVQNIRRSLERDPPKNVAGGETAWVRREEGVLRGDDGRMSYDKCQTASIDNEGGYKLDTWSECPNKHHGKEARRRLRKAGKILAKRQLEDAD